MGTMLDYLDWYGDFDFSTVPFNEVDNLALCQLAYLDLYGSVPTDGSSVPAQEASARYFNLHSAQEIYRADGLISPLTPFILQKMAAGKRFAEAQLSRYESRFDEHLHRQFASVCVELGDETIFVAYRGTDDTLVGWREDFEMSFATVHAQRDALAYLNHVGNEFPGALLRVGGHSKGGNLAVYASALCDDDVRGRILNVYDNDGPGFAEGTLHPRELDGIRRRVVSIVPAYCVIGSLFKSEKPRFVVQSEGIGLMQHSALNWQVSGSRFVLADGIDPNAARFNRLFANWMGSVPADRRGEFVDEVFDALEATGARTMSELAKADARSLKRLTMAVDALSPKSKRIVEELAAALLGDALAKAVSPFANLKGSLSEEELGDPNGESSPTVAGMRAWRRREKLRKRRFSPLDAWRKLKGNLFVRGVALLVGGIALMANAGASHPVVPLALVAAGALYALALLCRFIRARKAHEATDPIDAVMGTIVMAVAAVFLIFQSALAACFNLIMGGALLAYGVALMRRAVATQAKKAPGWKAAAGWCVIAIALGVVVLLHPSRQVAPVVFAVGAFSAAKGLADMVQDARRQSCARKQRFTATDDRSDGHLAASTPDERENTVLGKDPAS